MCNNLFLDIILFEAVSKKYLFIYNSGSGESKEVTGYGKET